MNKDYIQYTFLFINAPKLYKPFFNISRAKNRPYHVLYCNK